MSMRTEQPNSTVYDVCIVGAGPSGSTCAYYLARQGRKVLLLEKKAFPRDKLCGDAVCQSAQVHLERMGVLKELLDEDKGKWAEIGGLVSPSGIGFIGNSAKQIGRPLVIAVKRVWLDEKIAYAARRAGAELVENTIVTGATLSSDTGRWTVKAQTGEQPVTYTARVLVAADGALSRLTQMLGIPTPHPDGICSRAYVKAGTHHFDADGVVFYHSKMVPGYCALFREARGDVNFCTYIIPGGKCTIEDLHEMHHMMLEKDPHIRRALGPRAEVDKMRGAPLRLGGIRKSYGDHLLIIGDAAGHIDPLTGEGIHLAMDGAKIAADALSVALDSGDLGEKSLKRYHDAWMKAFGWDFFWSKKMAQIYSRMPLLVDASAALMQRRGTDFMAEWGKVMTGAAPKTYFLRPDVVLPILLETARQAWRSRNGGGGGFVETMIDGVRRRWEEGLA